jgi:hypothetical protein
VSVTGESPNREVMNASRAKAESLNTAPSSRVNPRTKREFLSVNRFIRFTDWVTTSHQVPQFGTDADALLSFAKTSVETSLDTARMSARAT